MTSEEFDRQRQKRAQYLIGRRLPNGDVVKGVEVVPVGSPLVFGRPSPRPSRPPGGTMSPLTAREMAALLAEGKRCPICEWTLAASPKEGCVPGDCCYRPDRPDEQRTLQANRETLATLERAHEAAALVGEARDRTYMRGRRLEERRDLGDSLEPLLRLADRDAYVRAAVQGWMAGNHPTLTAALAALVVVLAEDNERRRTAELQRLLTQASSIVLRSGDLGGNYAAARTALDHFAGGGGADAPTTVEAAPDGTRP